MLEMDVAQ